VAPKSGLVTSKLKYKRLQKQRLVAKPKIPIWAWLTWLKTPLPSKFFSVVTIGLLLAGLVLNFFLSYQTSVSLAKARLPAIKQSVISLFSSLTDESYIDSTLEKLEMELLTISDNLVSFLGGRARLQQDLRQTKLVLKKWLQAAAPLSQYRFTDVGLVKLDNPYAVFTDDLEQFLQTLQKELLPETKVLWQNFWIYRQLLSFHNQLSNLFELVEHLVRFGDLLVSQQLTILSLLGHFQKQRWLVFNQNTGEARPTGGFIGSYISIDVYKGRIHINESNSIYHPDNSTKNKLYAHPTTSYYGWFYGSDNLEAHGIRNFNYIPCFADSLGMFYEDFLTSKHAYPVDLFMFVTPQLLLDILGEATFTVPGVGVLNANNVMDEIEVLTALQYDDKTNPKKKIKEILQALLAQLSSITQQQGSLDWLNLFLRAILARDLQIWSPHENYQNFLQSSGLSPQVLCNQSEIPEIGILLANLSGDKRGLVTSNQFNLFAEKTSQGVLVKLKFKQLLPEKVDLARGFAGFRSINFVGLQLPPEATKLAISSPQAVYVPFIKPYYQAMFEKYRREKLAINQQIDYIIRSSYNLYDDRGNPPGFVYKHLNGSQVLGIYISDYQPISEVEFSFVLPAETKLFKFYGQPGLREPYLSLGQNLVFAQNGLSSQKYTTDYYKINGGLTIRIT